MLDTLRSLTLDPPAKDLAVYLYGPRWREAMRYREPIGWESRRGLLPGDLTRLLTATLSDRLAHDGRSTHENRSGGWWLLTPPTGWEPAAPAAVADLLRNAVEEVLAEAMRREDAAREEAEAAAFALDRLRRAKSPSEEALAALADSERDASRRAAEENLRAGLLSGLRVTAASSGRAFEVALWSLRGRPEFRLPEVALHSIAFDWFEERLALGEFIPDTSNRVAVADVKAAHTADDGPALPWRTLHRSLSALLGAPHRRVAWSLDALDRPEPPPLPEDLGA